jgi:hypothetical protein
MTSPAPLAASSTPPGLGLVGAPPPVPTTPNLGLPKPLNDADNWGDDYRRAMDYLDAHPGIAIYDDGQRPASPYADQVILERQSHRLLQYSNGQWVSLTADSSVPGPAGPAGPPGPAGQIVTQTFVQQTASTEWLMPHSLGHRPFVIVFDNNGDEMEPDISYPNPTLVKASFGFPMTGSAEMQ